MTALTLAAIAAALLGASLLVGGRMLPAGATRDVATWTARAALVVAAVLFYLRAR